MQAVLKPLGVEIVEASSGERALELARGDASFAVALVDVQMPRMDGFELAARLRTMPEFAIVSHELRTPLTSVVGWAKLARAMPQGPELAEALERNANAQMRLVDDLLEMSRTRTGKLQIGWRRWLRPRSRGRSTST